MKRALLILAVINSANAGIVLPDMTRSQNQYGFSATSIIWNKAQFARATFIDRKDFEKEKGSHASTTKAFYRGIAFDGLFSSGDMTGYALFSEANSKFESSDRTDEFDQSVAELKVAYRLTSKLGFSFRHYGVTGQAKGGLAVDSHYGVIDTGASFWLADRVIVSGGVSVIEQLGSDQVRPYFGIGYSTYADDSRNGSQIEFSFFGSKKTNSETESISGEKSFYLIGSTTNGYLEIRGEAKSKNFSEVGFQKKTKSFSSSVGAELERQEGSFKGIYVSGELSYSRFNSGKNYRSDSASYVIESGYRFSSIDLSLSYSNTRNEIQTEDYSYNSITMTRDLNASVRYNF